MHRCIHRLAVPLLAIATLAAASHARAGTNRLKDPEDGKFDLSTYLLEHKGALPVPVIITEPAVGYGGGLFLAFFQQSLEEMAKQQQEPGKYRTPNIYAAGGAATENGTWGAGGGGLVSFAENRWRWRGVAAYANLELTYYPPADVLPDGLGYSLDGFASNQQLLYRLKRTDAWLAINWIYLDLESTFDARDEASAPTQRDRRNSGLGLFFEYDSRDNIFTPGRGWKGALDAMFYEPAWGSDESFQTYRGHVYAYVPIGERFVLGGRAEGRLARGEVPFYMLPYIGLRGIPAMRYQGEDTAVLETELRARITGRWSLVGFVGAGRAWGSVNAFEDTETRVAGGTGFRYFLARRLGLHGGVDFAWGPEDFAFYIQMGSAWH